jgi:hypothetical protein
MFRPCGVYGLGGSVLSAWTNGAPLRCVSAALIASWPACSAASERTSLVVWQWQLA